MDIWIICLSLIVAILGIYYFFLRRSNVFEEHGIPNLKPIPLLGHMAPLLFRIMRMPDLVDKLYNLNSKAKYIGSYNFATPCLTIRDPELIKMITIKNFDNFVDHPVLIEDGIDPLWQNNLLFLRGEKWKQVRHTLSPAFTGSKMKGMFKLMLECGDNFVDYITKEVSAGEKTIEMKDLYSKLTIDVLTTCAFGISINTLKNPQNDFYVYGKQATDLDNFGTTLRLIFSILCPWAARMFGFRFTPKHIHDFFKNVISNNIRVREEKGIVRPDMIQLMMDSRDNKKEGKIELNIDDITSQAFIFFFGGFETTSTFLGFVSHELAVHPEIQEKLQQEIHEVLVKTAGELTYETLNELPYLDAVVNETLRLYPIAIVLDRMCVKKIELPPALPGLKPFVVEEGTHVLIPTFSLQRDSNYFKDPQKFYPERWLTNELKNDLISSIYTPFGLGPRICIGNRFALMEIKIVLIKLLLKCNLRACSKTANSIKFGQSLGFLSSEDGFWMTVQQRNDFVMNNSIE